MRKLLLGPVMAAALAVPAVAAEYEGMRLRVVQEYSLAGGTDGTYPTAAIPPTLRYSNVTTFLASGLSNGGATLQGTNTITRLVADDLTPASGGLDVVEFKFSMVNFNTTAVTIRPRVRFWFADGAGGAPGTYYNLPVQVGFSFNPVAINAQTATVLTATLGAGVMTMPTSTFWAGITFDNNNGTTGATATQLNNIGQGLFGPPVVGSSADQMFTTTAAGSFFPTNSPAGSLGNLGGAPAANFGWEFTVDSPIAVQQNAWSEIKGLYR